MMHEKRIVLDPRLSTIAEMVGRCNAYADIGCDHGRLGAFLLQRKWVDRALLMDISDPSLDKARSLIRLLTVFGMAGTGFQYETEGLEQLKDQPCLILMNHSCFLDMQIAYRILYPRHFNIVATSDGFVGFGGFMGWLMRQIGCIPTQKFVTDLHLGKDMT